MIITKKSVALLVVTLLLQGCFATPFFKNISSFFRPAEAEDYEKDPDSNIRITSLRIPQSGETITIQDPGTNEEYAVTIGEVYTSASGKLCGRYTIENAETKKESGLVCFENQEDWIKVPLQLPLGN